MEEFRRGLRRTRVASKNNKNSESLNKGGNGVMGLFGYRGGGDKPRKKQVIKYDKDGNVLGDDGYAMTKARKRLHRIFDAWFIYIFVMCVIGFVLMVLAYQQGAQFQDWNLVQKGGNQLNGWDMALLMRLQALLCVFTAVFSALINLFGFRWMYDRTSPVAVFSMFIVLGLASLGYFCFGMFGVQSPEPLSLHRKRFKLHRIAAPSISREIEGAVSFCIRTLPHV